jgi:hypothetical protein
LFGVKDPVSRHVVERINLVLFEERFYVLVPGQIQLFLLSKGSGYK